jgi:hypothetical protein
MHGGLRSKWNGESMAQIKMEIRFDATNQNCKIRVYRFEIRFLGLELWFYRVCKFKIKVFKVQNSKIKV